LIYLSLATATQLFPIATAEISYHLCSHPFKSLPGTGLNPNYYSLA
jgi:hypothetical protein